MCYLNRMGIEPNHINPKQNWGYTAIWVAGLSRDLIEAKVNKEIPRGCAGEGSRQNLIAPFFFWIT